MQVAPVAKNAIHFNRNGMVFKNQIYYGQKQVHTVLFIQFFFLLPLIKATSTYYYKSKKTYYDDKQNLLNLVGP